jgi:hypothetical protein
MSGIIAALFTLLIVFGTVGGIIFLLVWLFRHQTKKRNDAWGGVAQQHGLHYTGREIAGYKYGQPLRVYTESRGSGDSRTTYTVVSCKLQTPLDLGLHLRRHGFLNNMFHRSQDIRLGDRAFDDAFIISGDEPRRVAAALTPPLRQLLLKHLGKSGSFSFSDHGTSVECVGVNTNATWLSWAIEVCSRATHKLDKARHHIHVANALTGHRPAWAAYASARNLRGLDAPLCMWGTIDGSEVHAYAVRTAPHQYQLEVSLRFGQPLGLGLDVQPKGMLDKVAVLFGGQDHSFDDPVFDDVFRVKAAYPQYVTEVLDSTARAELLGVQSHVGPTTLSDDGITVRVPNVPRDPSAVPRIVQHLTSVSERLSSRALGERGIGPYR